MHCLVQIVNIGILHVMIETVIDAFLLEKVFQSD